MDINFVNICCATKSCHTLFAIPTNVDGRLRKTQEDFYCTFGHINVYELKTEEEKLHAKILEKNIKIAELETQLRQKCSPKKKKK